MGTGRKQIALGLIAVALLTVVLVVVVLVVRHRRQRDLEEAAEAERERASSDAAGPFGVSPDDPTWGDKSAPVTIVLFADFLDPFFAPVLPALEQVKTHYGPDRVRIVWKNRPAAFHPDARAAAIAGEALFLRSGNDAFWGYVAKVFADPSALRLPESEDASFLARAEKKVTADADDARHQTDWAYVWFDDSPTIVINGMTPYFIYETELVPTDFGSYRSIIDRQIAEVPSAPARPSIYEAMRALNAERERKRERQGGARRPYEPMLQHVEVGGSPALGPPDAPVTVTELSDFECYECKRVDATLTRLLAKYPTKLRVVWKNHPLPFERNAEAAAELALEALAEKGQAGFWQARDKLFASPTLNPADLDRIANELGIHVTQGAHRHAIDVDQRLAMSTEAHMWSDEAAYPRWGSVDGELTPLVLVNGAPIVNSGHGDIESEVDQAIEHADRPRAALAPTDFTLSPEKTRPSVEADRVSFQTRYTSHPEHAYEPVPPASFEKAIQSSQAPVLACYEAGLGANPTLGGRVLIEVVVDRNGHVVLAQDGGSSLPDARTARCIIDAVKGISFPAVPFDRLPFEFGYELRRI